MSGRGPDPVHAPRQHGALRGGGGEPGAPPGARAAGHAPLPRPQSGCPGRGAAGGGGAAGDGEGGRGLAHLRRGARPAARGRGLPQGHSRGWLQCGHLRRGIDIT